IAMYNLNNTTYNETMTNGLNNNCDNNQSWWKSLLSMSNGGSVICLPHLYAFVINSHSYYQIHFANTKGYLVNWFVYDTNAQDYIAEQYKLDKNIVDLIEQELAIVNQFVQGLYQLHDAEYSQADWWFNK
ncbi:6799_t:CDS:2, partial [Dentiscutata heterogama]